MKICWFTTGNDRESLTLLKQVAEAMEKGVIHGEVSVVFMNRERNESDTSDGIIAFAEEKGIPVELLGGENVPAAREPVPTDEGALFDEQVKPKIAKYPFDLIFQAGYTPAVSPVLHDQYTILRMQPCLPGAPSGEREDVIGNTIAACGRDFGAMIHKVGAGPDEDIPITFVRLTLEGMEIELMYQNVFRGDSSSKEMLMKIARLEVLSLETALVIKTLSLISAGEIEVSGGEVRYHGSPVKGGVDITGLVR